MHLEEQRHNAIAAMRNWTDGNTIEVTPTNSTYNSSSGELTVTFPNPTIPVSIGDRVAFKEDALNWSCTYNGTTANHPGPNETDPTYGKSFNIYNKVTTATDTIIYCNVGDAGAAAGVAHTFVSAISDGTIIILAFFFSTIDISFLVVIEDAVDEIIATELFRLVFFKLLILDLIFGKYLLILFL